jgi:hypothetical protein
MHSIAETIVVCALAITIGACGPTVMTKKYLASKSDQGVLYYLPKKRIAVKVVRELTDKDGLKRKEAAAKAKTDSTTKALNEAKQQLAAAKALLDNTTGDGVAEARKKFDLADAAAKSATKQAEAATRQHTAVLSLLLAARATDPHLVDKVTLTVLPAEADRSYQYVADLKHWINRDDELDLATTAGGLLTTVGVISTDRTGDILIELAALAAEVAKGMIAVAEDGNLTRQATPTPFTYEDVFDPAVPNEVARVNERLHALNAGYRVCAGVDGTENCPTIQENVPEPTPDAPSNLEGLVYRRPLPYRISVQKSVGDPVGSWVPLRTVQVDLPNRGPVAVVPFNSGLLVRTEYDVAFADGMMTSRSAKRPSELFGVVTTLTGIAKELVSIPAEMLQLKVDYASKHESIAGSEAKIVEAERDIAKLRDEIDKLQDPPAAP